MTLDRVVFLFAGMMILVGATLALTVHIYWIGLVFFVGLNMTQASLTRFCPLAIILKMLGLKSGTLFYGDRK